MRRFILLLLVLPFSAKAQDYRKSLVHAEDLIVRQEMTSALDTFSFIIHHYNFIFLRDIKIATELALYTGHQQEAYNFMRKGISAGWTLKDIKKMKFLRSLRKGPEWQGIKKDYRVLHDAYTLSLDSGLRAQMLEMFRKDQQLAFANLFKIGRRSKERFLNKRFIPQSEEQMQQLRHILTTKGYPGEKLTGESRWVWTIISHHNSISPDYQQRDTLYTFIRPLLLAAIKRGELSPYDFAAFEDWYITVRSDHEKGYFGYVNRLSEQELRASDSLRVSLRMRSVATNNALVDIEAKTGMDFFLEGRFWNVGKIIPKD